VVIAADIFIGNSQRPGVSKQNTRREIAWRPGISRDFLWLPAVVEEESLAAAANLRIETMTDAAQTAALAAFPADAPFPASPHPLGDPIPALPCERHDWTTMAIYIMLAGAAYPATLVLIFVCIGAVSMIPDLWVNGIDAHTVGELVTAAGMVFLYGVLCGAFVGFLWAGAVSLFVLPVMYMLARSLRVSVGFTLLSACCGGIVGFVAVMPFIALITHGDHWRWEGFAFVLALGPGLTTILGQLGGAIGGRREVAINWAVQPPEESPTPSRRPLQFGIRQLLWLSVWLSLLLTAIKLSGVRLELILPVLVGWILYQAATLYGGWVLATRVWPRWRHWRTSGRST
jgi:hypothetical protein